MPRPKSSFKLYLDETGVPTPQVTNGFPYFILSGAIVNGFQGEYLKTKADQIKFKYWGHTDIVFHSQEIGKKINDFSILNTPSTESAFHNDLLSFLGRNHVKLIVVAVDKKKAAKLNWNTKTLYENAAKEILEFFITFLKSKNARGQIIIESSGIKDISFLNKYSHYLSHGLPSAGLNHKDIKDVLTSLSFVSKKNFDIETQIADLLAYPAGSYCLDKDNIKKITPGSYEDKICCILKTKLFPVSSKDSFIFIP